MQKERDTNPGSDTRRMPHDDRAGLSNVSVSQGLTGTARDCHGLSGNARECQGLPATSEAKIKAWDRFFLELSEECGPAMP